MNILLCLLVVANCVSATQLENFAESTTTLSVNPITPLDLECSEIPTITNLEISPGSFNVSLQWEPPEDPACIQEYVVLLDNEYRSTSDTTLVISDLNACQEYEVAIAISDGTSLGQFVSDSFNTSAPASLSNASVSNLQGVANDGLILVTWEPPSANLVKCVTGYYLTWWDDDDTQGDKGSGEIPAPQTNYTMSRIGCMHFKIMVYPKHRPNMDGVPVTTDFNDEGFVTSAPTAIRIVADKTNAIVLWETDKKSKNKCKLQQIVAVCDAPDNVNADYPWIIPKQLAVLNITTVPAAYRFSMSITDLSPFTNYSCLALVTNEMGNSSTQEIRFTTSEDVTSEPKDVTVDIGSYSFNIHWKDPEIIPGIITSYGVVIRNEGPNYPLDEDLIDSTGLNIIVDADQKSLNYTEGQPYYNYAISVFAIDGAGNGSKNNIQITTLEGVTSEPANITIENGSHHFVIHWTDPKIVPGIITSYGVIISNDGPNYPLDEDLIDTSHLNTTVHANQKSLNFTKAQPYYNYNVSVFATDGAGDGPHNSLAITTLEGVTSALQTVTTEEGSFHFVIYWTDPEIIPGIITSYGLVIRNEGPNYQVDETCTNLTDTSDDITVPAPEKSYNFTRAAPYSSYTVSAFAINGAGYGNETSVTVATKSAEPDDVTNPQVQPVYSEEEIYSAVATVQFEPPCDTRGPFIAYQIRTTGRRDGFDDDFNLVNTTATALNTSLLPERVYSFEVVVVTEEFTSSSWSTSIQSRPGVPNLALNPEPPASNISSKAHFKLSRNMFNNSNGEVLYYALILLPNSYSLNKTFGFWSNTTDSWPLPPDSNAGSFAPYQLTPTFWNPFEDGSADIDFVIGEDEDCTEPCNKPLEKETEYSLIVRGLTSATYRDSPLLPFVTGSEPEVLDRLDWGLILGLTFGLLALLILLIFVIYLWRRKKKTFIKEEERQTSETLPTAVPHTKYLNYYSNIKENYNVLKLQFTELYTRSKEVATPISYAILPENKRKNRYTNILPYDQTRVKLKMNEPGDKDTDYINASYIKGYSDKIEYIATQGPLERTSRDFWKMVLQENVTVIVMVSQFIEQSKEKCHRYFPKMHEMISFGEALDVLCSSELHFGTYCIRSLQIRQDQDQRNIVHMQFLEWPDFGVPQSSNSMLQFCHEMREKVDAEGGLIVVHCSAGVGRTGTLIALDILLQTIDNHREINIFKTVLDLRKQRANMVQTEKQYMFIHTCVKEYVDEPKLQSNGERQDPIYENMEIIKSSLTKNLIKVKSAS